jgi:mRNA interferase MazF
VVIAGRPTLVLAEQTAAVDPTRLGKSAGNLTFDELRRVDAAYASYSISRSPRPVPMRS